MTADRFRIAVQLKPEHVDYARLRDAAGRAEDLGVDIIFNWDHFFPMRGDPEGKHFECWTMLGAWAEQTSRVEFGPLVTSVGYRNPDLLADMARTLDHISGGRFVLGIGSGWFEKDYLEYGYDFGTAGGRLDVLADALPRIEKRLGLLNPPPQRDIPILIGGGGEKRTLNLVARHADIWHSFEDVETVRRKIAILREHCESVGRDFGEIEISTAVPRRDPVARAKAHAESGASLFTVGVSGPDFDLSPLKELAAWRDAH